MKGKGGKMKKNSKEKGITLIALIITIIVMLILVLVSIQIAINTGLFDAAGKATQKTNIAKDQEQELASGDIVNKYVSQVTSCSHEWGEWEEDEEAAEKTRTCTECGEKETKIILVIGAPINYKEYIDASTGEAFTSMPSYKSTSKKNGYTNTTYTVANNSGIEWIVLGEEDGQIKITTKNTVQPMSGGDDYSMLRVLGITGYTNLVTELHEIGAIYGKGKYADTGKFTVTTGGATGGRSFKMEDLGYGEVTRTAKYTYAMHDDGKVYRHEVGEEIDYTTAGTTGGYYSQFEYMKLDASESTEETEELRGWSELKTAANGGPTSVTIYQYIYSGNQTLSTSVSTADKSYWLASRYINALSDDLIACNAWAVWPHKGTIGLVDDILYMSNRWWMGGCVFSSCCLSKI